MSSGGTKRPASSDGSQSPGTSQPPAKKPLVQLASFQIGPVYSLEEMDLKTLQFQNKKLTERLEHRRKQEEELRKRIEQLEKRQTTDDAVLCIVNRYWNQLDEDVRVMLQRFDAMAAIEDDENQNEATMSFLSQLSTWDKEEIDESLQQRVELSKRAISKLLLAYDQVLQRYDRLRRVVADGGKLIDATDDTTDKENQDDEEEKEPEVEKISLEEAVVLELKTLQEENSKLHNLVTSLQTKIHSQGLQFKDLQEKQLLAETEIAEFRNKLDDLEYDYSCATMKIDKLELSLAEAETQIGAARSSGFNVKGGPIPLEGMTKKKFQEMMAEMEDALEVAQTRQQELDKLQENYQEALKQIEKLKMDLAQIPEEVILSTTEYKCLKSQFSVLYNESMQMKTQFEETRSLLQTSKNDHLRHIEQMESDELACQKRLRTEVIQMEDTLASVRKEYELLKIEFEQTLAANEQTGPINREMRNLISSLQNQTHQLKGEVQRYKRKYKEAAIEIQKLQAEMKTHDQKTEATVADLPDEEKPETSSEQPPSEVLVKKEPIDEADEPKETIKKEKKEKRRDSVEKSRRECEPVDPRSAESDTLREIRQQLKKSEDSRKELKLLLDTYKNASKDQRDKVQFLVDEQKRKDEMNDLKQQLRRLQEADRKEKRKLADEDAIKKIEKLEKLVMELRKNVIAQKQEEEALLNEMEVTGQAFEDMQEQNIRLLQQLREKDDANFKLMSERIKSNQIHKLLREEKEVLAEQVATLQSKVEAQNLVVRKLEEKERLLQSNINSITKELHLRQQAMDLHKRKAIEGAQSAAELKLHLDKYTSQLKDLQNSVAEKTGSLEKESYKYRRVQEEVAIMRRKLERHKKIELAGTADEVLMEEIKEYKGQLTCPSCKVKKKDAILTKCFHVFCLECLRTRYETRQRKCPKCNAAFGANDFHRIYLDN